MDLPSYEISRALALSGARVIMINRKEEQGQDAIENIKKESEGKAQIEWISCDLGRLEEVQEVFTRVRTVEKRLDLVSSISTDKYYSFK